MEIGLPDFIQQTPREKGESGEILLNHWFQENRLSYLNVAQSPDTFATLFPGVVKRPDFLVLLDSIGLIAVDAKNYTLSRGEYTLGYEKEVKRVLAFERLFRIPVWYAYLGADGESWYWISALRALEIGEVRTNKQEQVQFLSIKVEHFAEIRSNADLGKLYTQRLPKIDVIASTDLS